MTIVRDKVTVTQVDWTNRGILFFIRSSLNQGDSNNYARGKGLSIVLSLKAKNNNPEGNLEGGCEIEPVIEKSMRSKA